MSEVIQFGETGIPFDTSRRHPKKLLSRIPRGNKADASSGFIRRAGIDGERMDAVGHPGAEGIIHEAMARNAAQSGEPDAHDPEVEMRAFAGARVSRVGRAVVHQLELGRL